MKNIVLAIVLSTLGFQNLHAQRFAFVDTDYLLNQMPDYRSAQKEIDQMSENWQKEIEQKYMEIEKMYKTYQVEKPLLTASDRKKREEQIILKERETKDFQNKIFGYEGELFKEKEKRIKPIQDKVYTAIQKVAKDNALDFIFDKSGQTSMLFTNSKFDKSDEVLDELGVVSSKEEPGTKGKTSDSELPPDLR
ncbi:MAG: hypothetical protein CNE98_02620 [Bacteroidetes bacterium MED-G17]|nr:MAG: hypothetical protein CBB99_00760 [Bacteroidetes bacterium TMED39]PDH53031.1 MAG: hypothetical protein CNE98_02620 [Bacteroidetes bacterium MED-G17]CAI8320092.1 MAG: Uncharacterised protein [Bacteroidetes bacterium MED-G17]|tara:strand:+ start:5260 stop:5838 length:579 start_codon:yes stop_codon:yes gene_type:complete